MRFDIVRDPAKIARIQKRLADRDQQLMTSRGALVRYEMPALPNAFPQLGRILESSAHRAQFFGIHYHIESKDGRIERLLPAAEYYEFVFRAVADKRYVLEFGLGRLRELERWIQRYYDDIREPMLRTEQPSLRVVDKVYALKSELGNILFVVRGTLDTIATLLHFLYGPSSLHFTDFAAFVNYLNQRHPAGAAPDPAMREYLRPECADRYPTLPARMWTSAGRLAELVASYRRAPQRPEETRTGRTLPEADFEFRGGFPRWDAR